MVGLCSSERISRVFQSSRELPFNDASKIVLISDCHRGDGSWADNFARNQHLYFAALKHYYRENYAYIELGDGDELWENRNLSDIIAMHGDAFWLLSEFYKENRLHLLFGNHDIVKRDTEFVRANLARYFDDREKKYGPLLPGIDISEGLILRHTDRNYRIFLMHGHQADFLNDSLWRLTRFSTRYIWRILELIGVNAPTSPAKNHKRKDRVEKKLVQWTNRNQEMLIAGHTHRPVFPEPNEPRYFNDGSCVHPRCITAIEIAGGEIMLVKWSVIIKGDGALSVGRDILAGPRKLGHYFDLPDRA
jgi:UDP-2,3-diacylglucosamine pyrophosphatase LpxH